VEFNRHRVCLLTGQRFGGGSTPMQSVADFLQHYSGLFGVSPSELDIVSYTHDPGGNGPIYVELRQTCNGITVADAGIVFTLANKPPFPITLVSSCLHPSPAKYLVPARLSDLDAMNTIDAPCHEPQSIFEVEQVIWPHGDSPAYAWLVRTAPQSEDRATAETIIDAISGQVFSARSLTHRLSDLTVTVKGEKSSDDTIPPDCGAAGLQHAQHLRYLTSSSKHQGRAPNIGQLQLYSGRGQGHGCQRTGRFLGLDGGTGLLL